MFIVLFRESACGGDPTGLAFTPLHADNKAKSIEINILSQFLFYQALPERNTLLAFPFPSLQPANYNSLICAFHFQNFLSIRGICFVLVGSNTPGQKKFVYFSPSFNAGFALMPESA